MRFQLFGGPADGQEVECPEDAVDRIHFVIADREGLAFYKWSELRQQIEFLEHRRFITSREMRPTEVKSRDSDSRVSEKPAASAICVGALLGAVLGACAAVVMCGVK